MCKFLGLTFSKKYALEYLLRVISYFFRFMYLIVIGFIIFYVTLVIIKFVKKEKNIKYNLLGVLKNIIVLLFNFPIWMLFKELVKIGAHIYGEENYANCFAGIASCPKCLGCPCDNKAVYHFYPDYFIILVIIFTHNYPYFKSIISLKIKMRNTYFSFFILYFFCNLDTNINRNKNIIKPITKIIK